METITFTPEELKLYVQKEVKHKLEFIKLADYIKNADDELVNKFSNHKGNLKNRIILSEKMDINYDNLEFEMIQMYGRLNISEFILEGKFPENNIEIDEYSQKLLQEIYDFKTKYEVSDKIEYMGLIQNRINQFTNKTKHYFVVSIISNNIRVFTLETR